MTAKPRERLSGHEQRPRVVNEAIRQMQQNGALGPTSATDGGAVLFDGTTGKLLKDAGYVPAHPGANTDITSVHLNQTGLGVNSASTNTANFLTIKPNETLSAPHTLNIVTGNADRTVTLSGNPTLNDWFDQSVKVAANPQFATIELGAASDTTLSRASAGVLAVEGNSVITSATTNWVLLNTLTAANSTVLSDTTSFTATYSAYALVFDSLIPATNAVQGQLQVHSASSFQATSYICSNVSIGNGSTTVLSQTLTTAVPITVSSTYDTANNSIGISGVMTVRNVAATSLAKAWTGNFLVAFSAAGVANAQTCGYWNSTGAVDGFQFLFSSGNVTSGTIKIYGIR